MEGTDLWGYGKQEKSEKIWGSNREYFLLTQSNMIPCSLETQRHYCYCCCCYSSSSSYHHHHHYYCYY
jgi:hypothetical protein